MNSEISYQSLLLVLTTVLSFARLGVCAVAITQDGSPANYATVPNLKTLQTRLENDRNLAAQGKLNQAAILADNVHNASVGTAEETGMTLSGTALPRSTSRVRSVASTENNNGTGSVAQVRPLHGRPKPSPAPTPVLVFNEGSVHISIYDAQDPAYKLSSAEIVKIRELLKSLPPSHLQNIKTIRVEPKPMQYGIVLGDANYSGVTLTISAGPTANRTKDVVNIPYLLLDGIGQAVYDHVLIDPVRQSITGSGNTGSRLAFGNSYASYVMGTRQTFGRAFTAFQNGVYGFSLGLVMNDLWRETVVSSLFLGSYAQASADQKTIFFVPSSKGPLGPTAEREQPFFQHPGQYIQIGRYRLNEGIDPNTGGLVIVSMQDMTTQQITVLKQPQAIPEIIGEIVPINSSFRPVNYHYL